MVDKRKTKQGLVGEDRGIFSLTPRQILIQKLNKLLYAAQINKISDTEANEILNILSHV
jgi:hypothetical protein